MSAAEQERAAVVAWLREQRDQRMRERERYPEGSEKRWARIHLASYIEALAADIARGAHRSRATDAR